MFNFCAECTRTHSDSAVCAESARIRTVRADWHRITAFLLGVRAESVQNTWGSVKTLGGGGLSDTEMSSPPNLIDE